MEGRRDGRDRDRDEYRDRGNRDGRSGRNMNVDRDFRDDRNRRERDNRDDRGDGGRERERPGDSRRQNEHDERRTDAGRQDPEYRRSRDDGADRGRERRDEDSRGRRPYEESRGRGGGTYRPENNRSDAPRRYSNDWAGNGGNGQSEEPPARRQRTDVVYRSPPTESTHEQPPLAVASSSASASSYHQNPDNQRPGTSFNSRRIDNLEKNNSCETGRRASRFPRTPRPYVPIEERFDYVDSNPIVNNNRTSKRGTIGDPIQLTSNFFVLKVQTTDEVRMWQVHNYRVDFVAPKMDNGQDRELSTDVKKYLLQFHRAKFGNYISDGDNLYSTTLLEVPMELTSTINKNDNNPVLIRIKHVGDLKHSDPQCLQFYNLIIRKCLDQLNLQQMGRNFYDPNPTKPIRLDAFCLAILPGFITTIRQFEHNLMLNVEIVHRVLRQDTALDFIRKLTYDGVDEKSIKAQLVGSIVLTSYNGIAYPVNDISFDKSPLSTFKHRKQGAEMTFADYFKNRYNLDANKLTDMNQPLLASRPRKKDWHGGKPQNVFLIPELCQMTGLTDNMRSNNGLMMQVNKHLQQTPEKKLQAVTDFMQRLRNNEKVQEDLQKWNLRFDERPVELTGRKLTKEGILMGRNKVVTADDSKNEWSFIGGHMQTCRSLVGNWVVIIPQKETRNLDKLVTTMRSVGAGMDFNIQEPLNRNQIRDTNLKSYIEAIEQEVNRFGKKLSMIFVVLPFGNKAAHLNLWGAVKRHTCVTFGIASQCFLASNLNKPVGALKSIVTKMVIQMNAKLGGVPWGVKSKIKKCMIIGYDVHHPGKNKRESESKSVGAMVATTNDELTRYYSTTSFREQNKEKEVSDQMSVDITKCLNHYKRVNEGILPERIIFYRGGVGEGQLKVVYDVELAAIKDGLNNFYSSIGEAPPKLTFIVVNKKINTRLFRTANPGHHVPCGTVVDDVITLPERFDFYLVSQHPKQGTVSPTSYNVLFDQQGQTPGHLQRLTYKLCHLYYNWNGPVCEPAVCHYASKLAYMTGVAFESSPAQERLSEYLYFL